MFNKLLVALFSIFCVVGVIYLALPNCDFPPPLPDAIVSQEPADLETPLRRGYFTNYSRDEVLSWYGTKFNCANLFGITFPKLLLNYPPEYAETIIRNRTDIGWLQEYVYPFREGIYINGYAPVDSFGQPVLTVNNLLWKQKIIIKHVHGNMWAREIIFIASMFGMAALYNEFIKLFKKRND